MIVRLTIQQDGARFRATIAKRDDHGNGTIGAPEIFLVDDKGEAKQRAKEMARSLGLKTYRVLDKTLKAQPSRENQPANSRIADDGEGAVG
jgi:hypothetical protein